MNLRTSYIICIYTQYYNLALVSVLWFQVSCLIIEPHASDKPQKMAFVICSLFRCRSSRFWVIVLVSFQILFDFAIIIMHSRSSVVNTEVAPVNERTTVTYNANSTRKGRLVDGNKVLPTTRIKPTTARKVTKKPEIDMVNDYQPWIDFKFVYPEVQPIIEGPRDFYLVVVVNSGAKGNEFRQRRAKIRETWASRKTCEYTNAMNDTRIKDLKWTLVFVLGKAEKEENERNIEEAKKHNDMIIGDINDNYLNNILKFYMGQLWASLLGTKYTLKTDDDVYVRIPKIIEYLVSEGSPSRFYGGETYPNTGVARWAGGKWSISKKYFAEAVFPPFNAGAFMIISSDLLGSLINYVYIRKPFHTDDAYIGVAMRDLKVKVVHILSFDIKNNMAVLVHQKNNCDILKLIAYGHSMNTPAMQHLHGRIEDMCQKAVTLKSCYRN